jgi:hypothetical protein
MKLIEDYLLVLNEAEENNKNVQNKIIEFFQKNKIQSDEQIHDFANQLGLPPHKLEVEIYKLLSSLINLKHGDDPDDKYDSKQLERGIEVEKEHIDNPVISKMIAKAHIAEIPDYYTRLDKMESGAGIKD